MKPIADAETPLVFVHTGPSQMIVTACVAQARAAGNKRIFVISDRVGPWALLPGVHAFPISNGENYGAREFRAVFSNFSSYPEAYAAVIFEKFFAIRALFEVHGIDRLLYIDSDVLIYKSATELSSVWPCDFTGTSVPFDNHETVSPGVLFMNREVCDRICSDLIAAYRSPESKERLRQMWEVKKAVNPEFGVCEMDFLAFLRNSGDFHYLKINEGNPRVDAAINFDEGCVFEDGLKKIAFENGLPYGIDKETGEKIFFYNLHMQGGLKYLAIHYAQLNWFWKKLLYIFWRLEKRGLIAWPKASYRPVPPPGQ